MFRSLPRAALGRVPVSRLLDAALIALVFLLATLGARLELAALAAQELAP